MSRFGSATRDVSAVDDAPYVNPAKILLHRVKVQAILAGDVPLPSMIELDLTNRCNHNCRWCRYSTFRKENWCDLPTDIWTRLLDECRGWPESPGILLGGGGEPTLHPQFEQVLALTSSLKLDCGVLTNGSRLRGAVAAAIGASCSYIRISLDAADAKSYADGHGVGPDEFDRVVANIRDFATQYGQKCRVGVTVVRNGDEYIDNRIEELFGDVPVSYVHSRPDIRTQPRDEGPSGCVCTPLVAVVGADGLLYPCCNYRGELPFGDLHGKSFSELWGNEEHVRMLKVLKTMHCQPCRYKAYNRIIGAYFGSDACNWRFL